MIRKTTIFLMVLLVFNQLAAKTITDMAGRKVQVPDSINKVLPYDAKTSILLFSVIYEKMLAKALVPGSDSYKLIDNRYNSMPEVDIKNIEEVLVANPQVIIAGLYSMKEKNERLEKLQKRTGIPVVVIDLGIDKLDQSYLFLGSLFKMEEKCKKRSDFLKKVYTTTETLKGNQLIKKETVYYTIGGNGLTTDPAGSKHTEVLDYMDLPNVADIPIPTGGHAKVNMEQVIIWNPDNIFCAGFKGNQNAYNKICTNDRWESISAVKNKKVYKVPSQPMGWFDHPPSVNRIPGIIWLNEIFYKQNSHDTKEYIIKFYKLFYNYKLSDVEYRSLFE